MEDCASEARATASPARSRKTTCVSGAPSSPIASTPGPSREAHGTTWRERAGVPAIDVELVCSDADEHRRRVEGRTADIDGHRLPTWQEVVERDDRVWEGERLVIDTARLSVDACVARSSSAAVILMRRRPFFPTRESHRSEVDRASLSLAEQNSMPRLPWSRCPAGASG